MNKLQKLLTQFPDVGFLEGETGQAFLEEYQRRVENGYDGDSRLDVLRWRDEDGVVMGSNAYAAVLENQILRDLGEGLRTANPVDIVRTLKRDRTLLERPKIYVTSSLVLRDGGALNSHYLRKQLNERGIKTKKKTKLE